MPVLRRSLPFLFRRGTLAVAGVEVKASLLVMDGYGHSRFSGIVLG
jgi:hypothetical protein